MKQTVLFILLCSLLGGTMTHNSQNVDNLNNKHQANLKRQAIDKKDIDLKNMKGEKTLRLLNWEDYIHLQDVEGGYPEPDLVDQFVTYIKDTYDVDINVLYSTTDTNETMLNELATGKAKFDLLCPSDYGIQKLMSNDQLVPIREKMEALGLNNYSNYASKKLISYMQNIEAKSLNGDEIYNLNDYAVGYMWGTLGIIFNPEFTLYQNKEDFSSIEMIKDMTDWSNLWNPKYYGGISIKDSVRDTYFIGLAEAKKDELLILKEQLETNELTPEEYNQKISSLLNKSDKETTDLVLKTLKDLKNNIFGLEVDSGKQDIVTGKVGINTAWSGDAVYSMDLADEYNDANNIPYEYGLSYALPLTGANIWFDGWCMPKDDSRSEMQETLALLFLDFISDPINAAQNTNYIGYTSFIGGDSTLELMKDWYDARTDLIYNYDEEADEYYSLFYLDDEDILTEVWYEDVHLESENDPSMNDKNLYYSIYDENGEYTYDEENGILVKFDSSIHDGFDRYNVFEYLDEENNNLTYNNHLLIDESWDVVDLSYFFNGTLTDYEDNVDTIFYAEDYYYKDEDGNSIIGAGRQFFCQFPDENTMTRCVVMADFGENNKYVVRMWEDFKSNDIEIWMYIIFGIELGLIVFGGIYFIVHKKLNKKLRKTRREEKN